MLTEFDEAPAKSGDGGGRRRGDRAHRHVRPALRVADARHDLERLLEALPPDEAQLFRPEVYILDEIEPRLLARDAAGQPREDAVIAETSSGCTDLVIDVRMRLLSSLEGSPGDARSPTSRRDDDLVLVTDFVTPSLVASLPRHVRGLIAVLDGETGARRDVGWTSHAAILARGRGLPIACVSRHESATIADATWLVLEASEDIARVWAEPVGADDAARSKVGGRHLPPRGPARTVADGLRAPLVARAWPLVRDRVAGIVTVCDDDTLRALALLRAHLGLRVEPSAAIGLAAALCTPSHGERVGVVLTGGNIDPDRVTPGRS